MCDISTDHLNDAGGVRILSDIVNIDSSRGSWGCEERMTFLEVFTCARGPVTNASSRDEYVTWVEIWYTRTIPEVTG